MLWRYWLDGERREGPRLDGRLTAQVGGGLLAGADLARGVLDGQRRRHRHQARGRAAEGAGYGPRERARHGRRRAPAGRCGRSRRAAVDAAAKCLLRLVLAIGVIRAPQQGSRAIRGQEYASWSATFGHVRPRPAGRQGRRRRGEAVTKNDMDQVTSSPRHPFGAKTFTALSHCFWQCSSLMKFPTASWTFS